MSARTVIYGCQLAIVWESKEANFARVRSLLQRTKPLAGSLLVLPEMFATGFSMNVEAITEGDSSPTTDFLREIAAKWKIYVLGGVVRQNGRGAPSNEALCFAPSGERVARYAKVHLFTPGGEARHYQPGDRLVTFEWQNRIVAPSICYDLRFPEIYRWAAQQRAEILVVIANWPVMRHFHWTALLQARAIENQAYVIGVNRCGRDPHFEYAGGSLVVSPHGEILMRGGRREQLFSAELDFAFLAKWRRDFAALKDMRTKIVLEKR